jgi:hypothetical protein
MQEGSRKVSRRWHTASVLAIGVAIGAVMVATPAGTHVGGTVAHLWKKHIKPKADVRYANAVAGTDKAKNANKVDGYSARQLIRVARMQTTDTTAITTGGGIRYGTPLRITAPKAGFVLINASVSVVNDGCTSECIWSSRVRHRQTVEQSTPIVSDTFDAFSATSASWVFPVSAGVNTFVIRLTRSAGNGTLNGWFAEMNAIYSPFGDTGGSTISRAAALSKPAVP